MTAPRPWPWSRSAASAWPWWGPVPPLRQAMVVGIYGMTLAVLFVAFQAPDVALSLGVGAVALPLMIVLASAVAGLPPFGRWSGAGRGPAAGLLGTVAAAAAALFVLNRHRLSDRIRSAAARSSAGRCMLLRTVHSGHVGDYVAWLALGAAALGGAAALAVG